MSKMFDAGLLAAEGINGWNKKEINEANTAHQDAYKQHYMEITRLLRYNG